MNTIFLCRYFTCHGSVGRSRSLMYVGERPFRILLHANTTNCTIYKEIAMTTQAMPPETLLNMANMSDEKLADFFFAKAFTDNSHRTRVHSGRGLAGAAPAKRWTYYGGPVDRDLRHRPHGRIGTAGTCLAAIGGTATHPRHGLHARVRAVNQVPAGPRRSLDRLRDGLQLLT